MLFRVPTLSYAGTRFWTGLGANANWTTAANWSNNVAPVANDLLVFQSGAPRLMTTNTFAANTIFSGFSLRGAYTLRGAAVGLTNFVDVVAATATLDLDARLQAPVLFSAGVNGQLVLASGRTVTLNGFVLTLDGLGGSQEVDGVITDSAGLSSMLIVTGAQFAPPLNGGGNRVVLNGAYRGPGPILVTNTSALVVNGSSQSPVIVASTTSLSGTGTVGGLTSSGLVAPGDSTGLGRLTVNGPCAFLSNASLEVTLAGTNAGVNYSQLQCSTNVSLSSARLGISRTPGFFPNIGDRFTILNKTNAGAISGSFAGLPQGASINSAGVFYQVSYTGGDGNDLTLIVTNTDTHTWAGSGGNGSWSTPANWVGNVAPTPSNHLVFPRAAANAVCTNNFASDTVFNSLRFIGSAATNNYPLLRGNSIRLLSGIVATNLGSQGVVGLELPLKLAASQTFTNASTNTAIELRSNLQVQPFTLTVRGPGIFRATGTVTGTNNANLVQVNGGHLVVNGALNGNLSVIGAGELDGLGTVGALAVTNSVLSPGDGGTGILSVKGALNLGSGSTLSILINSSTPGTGYDQVAVTNGNVTIGSATVSLTVASNLTSVIGDTITIIRVTNPTNTVSGTFAGLPQGALLTNNEAVFLLSYAGGDGNDVTLTLVRISSTGIQRQWTGAAPDTSAWSSRSNWSGNVAPLPGDSLLFPPASQVLRRTNFNDLLADTTFGGLRFTGDSSNYVVFGNAFRLNDGVRLEPSSSSGSLALAGNVTISNRLTINQSQTFTNAMDGILRFAGGIVLGTNSLSAKARAGASISFDGPVTGPGRLEAGTAGSIKLNASNAITGDLLASSGVLVATHPQALGTATAGPVHVAAGGTLQLLSSNVVFTGSTIVLTGRVEAFNTLNASLAASVLVVGSNATIAATQNIFGPPYSLTLAGAVTNIGQVLFSGGRLRVDTTAAVQGGGLIRLQGNLDADGVVQNTVQFESGVLSGAGQLAALVCTNASIFSRSIQPGSLSDPSRAFSPLQVGRLQLTAASPFGGTTVQFQLFPNRPGGGPTNTSLITTNAPDLGGAALVLTALTNLAPGQQFTLLRNNGAAPVTNTFANLPEGAFLAATNGNLGLQISYRGGDGNDVVVTVQTNTPPVIVPATVSVLERSLLTYTNTAIDFDKPPQSMSWALLSAPSGVNLNATTGVLTWTPTEAQGPSTNSILLKATDNGVPPLSSTGAITILVQELNLAPVNTSITNTNVLLGTTLTIQLTATDPDIPANTLTWSAPLPADATLSPSGLFTFTPTTNFPGTRVFQISVRDFNPDAVNQKSFTNSFNLSVRVDIPRVVTNTNDSGPGSLRQAILDVNNTPGPNPGGGQISFNIPGTGPFKIFLISALPPLLHDTLIDGYTQPGSHTNTLTNGNDARPFIELSGENMTGPTNGLSWSGPRVTLRGLVINRWDTAIATGRIGAGGSTPGAVIEGCFIGTDPAGTLARTNRVGINFLEALNGRIGGAAPAQRNLISGNAQHGIALVWDNIDSTLHNLTIQNNFIGTDRGGTNLIANGGFGIFSQTDLPMTNSVIANNVISGNAQGGVQLAGARNFLLNNLIGLGADGVTTLTNGGPGVELFANQVLVGGGNGVNANFIANNNGPGVHVSAGTNNAILSNGIFRNRGLGIDLGIIGPDPNDLGDLDTGPNNLQNTPMLATNIVTDVAQVVLSGTLASAPSGVDPKVYRVEFFHSPDFAPNNQPQGRTFLGWTDVATDGNGNASFAVMATLPSVGGFVSATATDPNGNTSEMSAPTAIQRADFYAGVLPNLGVVSGNNQTGSASLFLPQPLVVRVTDTNGIPLSGAPLSFVVVQGGATLASSFSQVQFPSLNVQTTGDGQAQVLCHLGPIAGATSLIKAIATSGTNSVSVIFAETAAPLQPQGVLLQGAPDSPALGATVDMPPIGVTANQIEDGLIMTRLDVVVDPHATVGQVNAALSAVGAGIVTMRPGSPFTTVAIPPPATMDQLENVIQILGSAPGIDFALPAQVAQEEFFPFSPVDANGIQSIAHLAPERFPAAWNASPKIGPCTGNLLPVIVQDSYLGDLSFLNLGLDFNAEIPNYHLSDPPPDPNDSTNMHGYQVTCTLGASMDDNVPTGANPFPGCMFFHMVNMLGLSSSQAIDRFARKVDSIPGKFVVNRSMGFKTICTPNCTSSAIISQILHPITRALNAAEWMLYTSSRWNDFFFANAAGNDALREATMLYPGFGEAQAASEAGLASLGSGLFDFIQDHSLWDPPPGRPDLPSLVPAPAALANFQSLFSGLGLDTLGPAGNVLIVGSVGRGLSFLDQHDSLFSNHHSDVKAVGENVSIACINSVPSTPDECTAVSGTSFASPQVAGLASYLWLLSPELKNMPASATAQAIKLNTRPNQFTTGIVDAYATVLSLDKGGVLPTPSSAPIRFAILNLNGDAAFDEHDLQTFLNRFVSNGVPVEPQSPDFSRFDLNGDGFTGGSRTERFDLDRVDSTQFGQTTYGMVQQTVEGESADFDETNLTDLQIFCYYAYSGLYTGDPMARSSLLCDVCTPNIFAGFFGFNQQMLAGQSQQFAAFVQGLDDQTLVWSVDPPEAGTITQTGLFTAACPTANNAFAHIRVTSQVMPCKSAEVSVSVALPLTVNLFTSTAGGTTVVQTLGPPSCIDLRAVLFNSNCGSGALCLDDGPDSAKFPDGPNFVCSSAPCACESAAASSPIDINFSVQAGSQSLAEAKQSWCYTAPRPVAVAVTANRSWGVNSARVSATLSGAFSGQVVYEIGNGQVTTDSSLPSFSLTEGAILSFLMDAKCTGNSAGSGTAIAVKFTPLAAGTFVLEPSVSSVAALTPFTEAFTWTVPTPFNWHRLTNLELRIRDANNIILWIRFNEADRTFSLFNDAAGRFGHSFSAGANVKLQTSSAELDLGRTSVVAAGPTSPTVTLNLGLEFLPSAAGKTYSVEVAALDDSGNADGFIAAGLLTVLPLR